VANFAAMKARLQGNVNIPGNDAGCDWKIERVNDPGSRFSQLGPPNRARPRKRVPSAVRKRVGGLRQVRSTVEEEGGGRNER